MQRRPTASSLTLPCAQELQAADLHELDAKRAALEERLTALSPRCAASQGKTVQRL